VEGGVGFIANWKGSCRENAGVSVRGKIHAYQANVKNAQKGGPGHCSKIHTGKRREEARKKRHSPGTAELNPMSSKKKGTSSRKKLDRRKSDQHRDGG